MPSGRMILLVRLAGFEPATYGLEVRCSIRLSYRRTFKQISPITYDSVNVYSKQKGDEVRPRARVV